MKIRFTGNKNECELILKKVEEHFSSCADYSVSKLYPNRNSNQFRVYIDLTFRPEEELTKGRLIP